MNREAFEKAETPWWVYFFLICAFMATAIVVGLVATLPPAVDAEQNSTTITVR